MQFRLSVANLSNEEFRIQITKQPNENTTLTVSFAKQIESWEGNLFEPVRAIKSDDTICYAWNIPDFGLLKLCKDGTVFFTQDKEHPLLLDAEFTTETSGKMIITSLKANSLILKSRENVLAGAIIVDSLSIDHDAINESGLKVRKIIGSGCLINSGLLDLQPDAVLEVARIFNKKSKVLPVEAKINGSTAVICSEINNGEGAQVGMIGRVNILPGATLVNKGSMTINNMIADCDVNNTGFFQSFTLTAKKSMRNSALAEIKILEQFSCEDFQNEGDIKAEKSIIVKTGRNKGKIVCEWFYTRNEMINEGTMNVGVLSGEGRLVNRSVLHFTLESRTSSLSSLTNEGSGKITGKALFLQGDLTNSASIDLTTYLHLTPYVGLECKKVLKNSGFIKANELHLHSRDLENEGTVEVSTFNAEKVAITNLKKRYN